MVVARRFRYAAVQYKLRYSGKANMTILSTWLASVRRAFASGNPAVVVWRLSLAFVVLFWSLTSWVLFGWIKLVWAFWLRMLSPAGDVTATTADVSVAVSGQLREVAEFGNNPGALRMFVYRPKGLLVGAPLVVVLHGSKQSAHGYAAGAGWLELADRYKFALVCPQQTRANNGTLSFQWFSPKDTAREGGEADSIAEMVRHALATENLDKSRVFVTGLSSGGAMTAVMLATHPEMFVAGAVIAGLPYGAADSVAGALWAMFYLKARTARAWGRGTSAHGQRFPSGMARTIASCGLPLPRRWWRSGPTCMAWRATARLTRHAMAARCSSGKQKTATLLLLSISLRGWAMAHRSKRAVPTRVAVLALTCWMLGSIQALKLRGHGGWRKFRPDSWGIPSQSWPEL
jgi:poly(hydroxyalkanoate) depolymerase family esterase